MSNDISDDSYFPYNYPKNNNSKTGKATCLTVSARSKNGVSQLVQRLRIATQPLHRELDARLRISAPHAEYADVLAHLGLFHAWLEQIMPMIHSMPDSLHAQVTTPNLQRLQALCHDLDLPAPVYMDISSHSAVTAVADRLRTSYRWGMQYVIEGSMRGAISLLPRIEQLSEARQIPHFFRLAATHGHAPWQIFTSVLEHECLDEEVQIAAEQGARDAFALCLKTYHLPPAPRASHAY
ncbi:biliverdin-producing heme oxygenase [Methylovorus mays]|uniref:biliverdin-producing heme oxygenase n=1 Tax=Methylovorus mays TaxID=184077 RepID=UPI001E32E642|nr:biliverdin-producing heme oxygenase [Methylovorus mays]MCB5206114.1 biliverdin-producing heme oxygenase [Methylovorus mays]